MTVYNINLGLGWASSGVEYAQAYRAKVFRQLKQEAKFIFMDLILENNLQHLASNIGFSDEEVIWPYSYFTDVRLAPSTMLVDALMSQFSDQPQEIEARGDRIRYSFEDGKVLTCYLKNTTENVVEQIEHSYDGYLLRRDYYSYTKYCSEFFAPKDGVAKLYQRTFYNEDGSVAYDMLIGENDQDIYRFPDQVLYGKQAFIRYFMQSLSLTKDDVVILDRETGIGQVVFEESQKAHLGVVVHAEHYSENTTDQDYILWNNYYDYQFTHADKVDFFIVATERQKEVLAQQFAHYTSFTPKIYVIPVGALKQLTFPSLPRKPFSLMTASRLAEEKHIDWLIQAVVQAQAFIPELTLDIYGSGATYNKLQDLIQSHGVEDSVRMLGHHDLSQVYRQYQAYVTASTSEGFGLTLMEAVGSGLPIVGFDVPYGNQTFIRPEENGYLIPSPKTQTRDQIGQLLSDKICQLFLEADLPSMQKASYHIAQSFLTQHVKEAWSGLLEEVLK